MHKPGWQFWIDRGGTFTDVIGCAPDGNRHSLKLLSEQPSAYADAPAEGIRRVLQINDPDGNVNEVRMGTTVATNALLERKGARTGLLITRGFGDTLLIGNQDRPQLFDLNIHKPAPLFTAVAEINERLAADGEVLMPLDTESLQATLAEWRDKNIDAVAICLVHGWRNPIHEQLLANYVRSAGFEHVHCSHEVSPLMKLVGRAGTTVADAYLSPVLLHYVAAFRRELRAANIDCERLFFMQSNGGLVTADRFRGKDAILSGPAGGVVAMQATGANAGLDLLIGFDMGGTSTDVSVCTGAPEIVNDTEIAGVHLRTPMIRIHTIAAGGGSLLRFDNSRFQVGPESAGAYPGPLSYGHGGPLTLTDANLLLGRVQADFFPSTFGHDGEQALDQQAVHSAFAEMTREFNAQTTKHYSAEQTAEGFLRIAVENMANAVRHISVSRGLDPAHYTLCCFGGAGGQHACRVADRLHINRILLDPYAGVLSAWGMGIAPLRSYRQHGTDRPLCATELDKLTEVSHRLTRECRSELLAQGARPNDISHRVLLNLKASGTDTLLTVEWDTVDSMRETFTRNFFARFGFAPPDQALHIDSMRCEALSKTAEPATELPTEEVQPSANLPEPITHRRIYLDGCWHNVPLYERSRLSTAQSLRGPALIIEANSATVLESGWTLSVNRAQQLLLERDPQATIRPATAVTGQDRAVGAEEHSAADPVQLEIINNRFVAVADEMGTVLRKTALSVNIRERLDFSCALFTAAGDLIANAPHVPVHLGSMDDTVKTALRTHSDSLRRGGVILTNAPYSGGTHLPDVTAISAVVSDDIDFIVASRAHHADIGGITPGSMPPFSRHIDEEGVLLDHFTVVQDGQFHESALLALLTASNWPARNPAQNIADFKAQIAANERGRNLMQTMLEELGNEQVKIYARHVQTNAEMSVRNAISRLHTGSFCYPMDNGQQICAQISIDHEENSASIDFSGTSAAGDNNLNAPRAVCQAAVLYVFRTLVSENIPLNAGCNKPLQLIIPAGSMLDPGYPAAVVGGNVETSQCIVDTLFAALGVLGASQGTMNNLSFGNLQHQYYETIGGGAGAGKCFDGADAVQTHMTNTRITDVEVLESCYPVLLREFAIRRNSGGAGAHRGGNGIIRSLEFRTTMSAAILSNHRKVEPFGLCGGSPGKTGCNVIVRRNGKTETHDGTLATTMEAGDVLIIKTPGGGGFGTP